jgi:sugar lactone lactonase YvrE
MFAWLKGRRLAVLVALAAAACLSIVLAGAAGAERSRHRAGKGTFVYQLAGGDPQVFPEGVAVERRSGSFFVSSTGSGAIYRGKLWRGSAHLFLPGGEDGRSTAVGLEVDRRGRLYVAGGATGYVWVYDIRSQQLIRRFATGAGGFLNDLVVTPAGDVWVTDSFRPTLFRIPAAAIRPGPELALERPLSFEQPEYVPGAFNLNGIAAGPRARYLLVGHYQQGELWRVELPSGRLSEVDLGGASVFHGDGLVRRDSILYVVRSENAVDRFRLYDGGRRARHIGTTTDPTFDYTTTAALARGRLLVVNSQFNDAFASPPRPGDLPFTVSSIKRP